MLAVIKKLICVCLTPILLLGCFRLFAPGCLAEEPTATGNAASFDRSREITGTGVQLCASDGRLELYADTDLASFRVKDCSNGFVWYGCPADWEDDEIAFGLYRMEMPALICIDFVRKEGNIEDKVNSYTGSVLNDDYAVFQTDDGFLIDFRFEDISLSLTVVFSLSGSGVSVRALTGSMVQEDDGVLIEKISLLKLFGAGREDGYLFVPDGCGALIDFDNGKYMSGEYERPVYGEEPTEFDESRPLDLDGSKISYPVYGIKNGDNAFVAALEDGAESAYIKAGSAGRETSYANVYAQYHVYGKMLYALANESTMIYEPSNPELSDLSLELMFLSGNDADYSGMARRYREYLKDRYGLSENGAAGETCYLTLHGGVEKTVSYFGVAVSGVVPLTTVSQLETALAEIKAAGIDNATVNYTDWNRQELSGRKVTSARGAGRLGSIKKIAEMQTEDTRVYLTASKLLSYSRENFISRFFNASSLISGLELQLFDYTISLGKADKERKSYLHASDKIEPNVGKYAGSLEKSGLKFAGADDLCGLLYNDYDSPAAKREKVRGKVENALSSLDSATEALLMTNPNQYALPYAFEIVGLPLSSSRHEMLDRDVPFVQIVLSPFLRYGSDALNFTDERQGMLKSLETGSMLHYEGFYASTETVKGTALSSLCNGSLGLFLDKMARQYAELASARECVRGASLYSHEIIGENVCAVAYDNGVTFYINYGDENFDLNGLIVPRQGFYTERGELNAE